MFDKTIFSAVILSSGSSSRMQTHKSELLFDSEQNFFQKITGEYLKFGCKEITVVMNTENYNSLKTKIKIPEKIKIVINKFPEKGRFYSLKTGISELQKTDFCFIQNIDNPFTDNTVLELLASNSDKADYMIPSYKNNGGHPILISEEIINAIKETSEESVNMKDFLNRFKKHYVKHKDEKILANINTLSDYHFYF